MTGKDKAVEMIDDIISNAVEYETSGDGLDNYWLCFESYNYNPDYRLIIARAVDYVETDATFSDIYYDCKETDISDNLFNYINQHIGDVLDLNFIPGIFISQRDQCVTIDSVALGEIEVQIENNQVKDRPLLREYYNRHGEYYLSDNGYGYTNIDGSAALQINLDRLADILTDYEEETADV